MMDDIIEMMARALDDGDYPMATYRRDVIDMLDAAEKAGWRLVPVASPTDNMISDYESKSIAPTGTISIRGYRAMVKAAPRPWEKNDG